MDNFSEKLTKCHNGTSIQNIIFHISNSLSKCLRSKKASKEKYSSLSIPRNLFLCNQPLSQALNLLEPILLAKTDGKVSFLYFANMLKYIFGNATAEKVLLHIYHYGSIHAAAIASDYGLSVTPILNQLERFEKSGVLIAKTIGKSRVYSFNPKMPFVKPIKELLKIAYESIPLNEKEILFKTRRRPRSKGKSVIYGV